MHVLVICDAGTGCSLTSSTNHLRLVQTFARINVNDFLPLGQGLSPGSTVRIKVRNFTNTNSTVAEALTKPFIVESRRVESTAIVPDRYANISRLLQQNDSGWN